MQKVKIQHYVPRFYLRRFSRRERKAHIINCFDKLELKHYRVNIENIGCEKYFYDIDEEPYQVLEKVLADYEVRFDQAYEKLVTKKHLHYLNWDEKESIAYFVATQEIRTRETREFLREIAEKTKKLLSEYPKTPELERQLKELGTDDSIRSRHLKMLVQTLLGKAKFSEIILSMKWVLSENNTSTPFWTSDHPVNRYNPLKSPHPFLGNLGLLSRGIQIVFPLTPKLCLLVGDPVEYATNPDKVTCIRDNVLFVNTLQLGWATRHIFSPSDDFAIARKWLNDNPVFKSADRHRVEVFFGRRKNPQQT